MHLSLIVASLLLIPTFGVQANQQYVYRGVNNNGDPHAMAIYRGMNNGNNGYPLAAYGGYRGVNYGTTSYQLGGYRGADTNPANTAAAYQIGIWFNKFFGGKDGGNKAFNKFVKQSKKHKKRPGKPATPHDDSDDDDDDKEPTVGSDPAPTKPKPQTVKPGPLPEKPEPEKEPTVKNEPAKEPTEGENKEQQPNGDELPVSAKAFAFYGATYGCQTSKVYEEFIKRYKDGSLPNPPLEDGDPVLKSDETWLKALAEDEVDGDAPATTTVQEAELKVKGLEKDDLHILKDGEAEMPILAQIFIRFVKVQGCQDTKLTQYKKFNEMFKEVVEDIKKKGKKYPSTYYVAKADTIILENFPKTP